MNLIWWWLGFFGSLIAAFCFIIGSFFFIPRFSAHIDIGVYLFLVGVSLFWACSAWSAYNYRSRHVDAKTRGDFIAQKVLYTQ